MPKKSKVKIGLVKLDKDFLDLNVNVFQNKRNGQLSLALPKKILKDIPKKINIKIPIEFFKKVERGEK